MCTTHVDHRVAGQPLESTVTIDFLQVSLWTSTEFEIGANFKLLISRNWNELAMRVEGTRGIRKSRVGNDLPVARRQQPSAAPSGLEAGAGESACGGKERERKSQTHVTQRNAPTRGAATTIERSKMIVHISYVLL